MNLVLQRGLGRISCQDAGTHWDLGPPAGRMALALVGHKIQDDPSPVGIHTPHENRNCKMYDVIYAHPSILEI